MQPDRTRMLVGSAICAILLSGALLSAFPAIGQHRTSMPSPADALPGRSTPIRTATMHFVFRNPLAGPFPRSSERAFFALGCFWGAERRFWNVPGVLSTAAGYAGGFTRHPTYEEVSSGRTGHAETVQVVFDPSRVRYVDLLRVFWEAHDPTQGMRQGNDVGTQYRSAIFTTNQEQNRAAEHSKEVYQRALSAAGHGRITTEVANAGPFYFAEEEHQQYLAKNPNGYCGHGGTGVSCPIGLAEYPAN